MKKMHRLLCFIACSLFSFMLNAQSSTLTKNYYINEFCGESIDDVNGTITGLNWSNTLQFDSTLSIDVSGAKLYDVVFTIVFTSPLDLSSNSMLTIEGMWKDLILNGTLPTGTAISPQLLIKLHDINNNSTLGSAQVYSFGLPLNGTNWTSRTLDMKKYPGSVDFTKIKKLSIAYQAQSSATTSYTYQSGRFLFRKIELGVSPFADNADKKSILTQYSFWNDFTGKNISDANQISAPSSTLTTPITQSNGRLDINLLNGLKTWSPYFRTTFAKPIDMSKTWCQKAKIQFEVQGLVPSDATSEKVVHLRMRIFDANGVKKIVELSKVPEGISEYNLDFGSKTYTEPSTSIFDYSKVASFEITSYNKAINPGHLYIDYLTVGAEIIPLEAQFESLNSDDGLTISVNPTASLINMNSFNLLDVESGRILNGVTATAMNSGAKFNFKGSFETGKFYSFSIKDSLYYLETPITFSEKGIVKNISVKLTNSSSDSIKFELSTPIDLNSSNINIVDKATGDIINIASLQSTYTGQVYTVFLPLKSGLVYELQILADGYSFGAPINFRPVQNPVSLSINWNNTIGQLTANHWGVNDNGRGASTINTKMSKFYEQIQPGVIRLHYSGLVQSWVDNVNQAWNVIEIQKDLDNAKDTYKFGNRLMVTLDACPSFISSTLPLTEIQEDQLAVFFAKLPIIVKQLGYSIDLYEFLNEKENAYKDNYPAYWRMLNKIAIAMKTADPTVKCGGPAVSWPTSAIYKGFIDNCKDNMDFVSVHLYARGPSTDLPDDDVFTGGHAYRGQAISAGAVAKYLVSNNITHMECFLNEFNVQYVWQPYEPMHHNHLGASWMACFIKNVALQGVTGLNVWNTEDGAYGLNYNSAPANLYLMSTKYLRGDIVESKDSTDKVEIIPVLSASGSKSVLFVNRTGTITTIMDAKQLIGGDISSIKGMRLDGTTLVENKVYTTQTMDSVPTDVVLNPYGMILLTNVVANPVTAPTNVKSMYVLENEIGLIWTNKDVLRKGFRITVNDTHFLDLKEVIDTAYVFRNLLPDTDYRITISTLDEYGSVFTNSEAAINIRTRKIPLKINDRTLGNGIHQFNYDKNWIGKISSTKIRKETVYNKDITSSIAENSSTTIQFKGNTIALYGLKTNLNKSLKIYVDDKLQKEYLTSDWPTTEGLVYYESDMTDEVHTLKVLTDATFSIDRLDVYGSSFENITTNPPKVENVNALPSTNIISMSWDVPQYAAGIQYYRILVTDGDSTRVDTVYSPAFTILNLRESTVYPVIIEAYDPCGNKSVSEQLNLSTIKKVSTQVAKLVGLINIDGVADEQAWVDAQRFDIKNNVGATCIDSNFSGWFKILWAQKYLYLNINVTDNMKLPFITGSDLNMNDGFELFFDGNNLKTGPYGLKDAYVQASYSPVQYKEYNNINTMLYAVADNETGYSVEVRYNLADLGMAPGTEGKEFGFDIYINDNDKDTIPGIDNQLTWQQNSIIGTLNKGLLGNMLLVNTISGISTVNNLELSLYPNPVINYLNLTTDIEKFTIRIFNNMGELVIQNKDKKKLDVSKLKSGIYIFEVISDSQSYKGKFIKSSN